MKWLLIAVGGAVGSVARYGTGSLLLRLTERTLFPWGTLAVNLLGCLVIGYLNGLLDDRLIRPEFRFLAVIGQEFHERPPCLRPEDPVVLHPHRALEQLDRAARLIRIR